MVNRVGNSNLSRPGLSQADANRAARAEHRAARERIEKSKTNINALRNSLLNPVQNTKQSSYSNNSDTLDQFLDQVNDDYAHLDFDSITVAPQGLTDKLRSIKEDINTAKKAEKDRVTKVPGTLEDFVPWSLNPYFEQAARYNLKYRAMNGLKDYHAPEWMDLDGSVKEGYEIPGTITVKDVPGQMKTSEIAKKITEAQSIKTEIMIRSTGNSMSQSLLLGDMLNVFKDMRDLLEKKIENQEAIVEMKQVARVGKPHSIPEKEEYNQAKSELSKLKTMEETINSEIKLLE